MSSPFEMLNSSTTTAILASSPAFTLQNYHETLSALDDRSRQILNRLVVTSPSYAAAHEAWGVVMQIIVLRVYVERHLLRNVSDLF